MKCAACGTDNRPGRRFCAQCGARLDLRCPSCGAANDPGDRFCGECGVALQRDDAPAPGPSQHGSAVGPAAEVRLVSVLFADLVGFTTYGEGRDPEEVRDLLSRYFERCRALIERYGGTVEKFIGDAVMAVWGTPVAREDDPERAVRAALALTQSITALGEEEGMPGLRVRAGVLTGSAAVDVGSEAEGRVLGDTVNTASRLQAMAEPGGVLVDDVTRRASEAAIAYEDAGVHEVRGREQPVHAWTALRVVAGSQGARRGVGLEAPFVGRDAELRVIIDAGEQSAAEGRAGHAAVVGEAGMGKSRLLWEYFKYCDGIKDLRWWHQGRCLSYGEGVAYWALAEMVRARAGIAEEEAPGVAREKLRETVEQHVPDERERRLVEPRLAHLLRLEERPDADRADLFSGWRLFFERLAAVHPVVLIFEDLHWADSGLLDFIDYLLEWSADFPIFVVTVARPELRQRRPSWEPLLLSPLDPEAVGTMLDGLAPGLPDELVEAIGRRSEGIPLYAVETIRMLQDRGVLVQEGNRYAVIGELGDLDVPETLQALVASRLDGLSASERSLLQDASVLGQSFSAAGAAALSGRPESDVVGLLDGLVTKQVLARDDDPRSPERGQYVFLQALLRTVAYGTLSRHARKARHVAAARHLRQTWPGQLSDIAEVLASHYRQAIDAEPDAGDVGELRTSAREALTAAGRAAASLALGPEALRYFEEAAALAEDDAERAQLFEQAGQALWHSGDADGAEEELRRAMKLYQGGGRTAGGSAAIALANTFRMSGRLAEARELLEPFRSEDELGVSRVVRAQGLAGLASTLVFAGRFQEAGPLFDEALTTLEREQAWPELADALVARTVYLIYGQRREEGVAVLRHALALAERHDLPTVALRARFNLSAVQLEGDHLVETVEEAEHALRLARERGDRAWEDQLRMQEVAPLVTLGRWDEAFGVGEQLMSSAHVARGSAIAPFLATIAAARGDEETLDRCRALAEPWQDSSDLEQHCAANLTAARIALERGSPDETLRVARRLLDFEFVAGELTNEAYALCVEAALALEDADAIADLEAFVAAMPRALATPLRRAGRARLSAELVHRRGDAQGARNLEDEAIALLETVGARPLLARTLLERARRHQDDEALAQARAIYTELGATRWLARIDEASEVAA